MTTDGRKGKGAWAPLLLLLLVLAVYGRTAFFPFVTYDDAFNVWRNPVVSSGLSTGGIRWAMTNHDDAGRIPLTWLSRMADVSLFGMNAGGHHAVNVLLHGGASILFFLALRRMTGRPWESVLAAALWAVHPVHVESVAWVTERKDVLSAFFWMLALFAYARYAEAPSPRRYGAVLLAYLLGLLSKPTVLLLPFVLLLLDVWPLGRLRLPGGAAGEGSGTGGGWMAWVEKLPLLLLTAANLENTLSSKQAATELYLDTPLWERLLNTAQGYGFYLEKAVFPSGLAFYYTFPSDAELLSRRTAASALLLAAGTIAAVAWRRRRGWLCTGWFWFLVSALPSIGLVRYAAHGVALRNAYLPLAGIYVATAWSLGELAERTGARKGVVAGAVVGLAALSVAAFVQVGYWRSPSALFGHSMAVTGENGLCRLYLGMGLANEGRFGEAEPQIWRAAELFLKSGNPFPIVTVDLYAGDVLAGRGDFEKSARQFESVLLVHSDFPEARGFLAYDLARMGRFEAAAVEYRKALSRYPGDFHSNYGLGVLLALSGDRTGAAERFRQALRIEPGNGLALRGLERVGGAGGEERWPLPFPPYMYLPGAPVPPPVATIP